MADPTEAEDHTESSVIKELRAKAKRVETAESEAAKLRQELALTKAGLDGLNEKQVKALMSAHEGDFTADAIKATADELGFVTKPAAPAETEVSQEQAQIGREVAELGNFAGAPSPESAPDHSPEAIEKMIAEVPIEELDSWMVANRHLFPNVGQESF